ncbi:hypothetical protein KIH39_18495 [Telmatocola sphagniphila]|uniref:Uncharacterized protein n=1 Tax=Telmatocola sphagniphila TaxID=1123043 RepID=A0A8E6B5E1_9BACT|nr:hypothetical protein [Telmatocola sphagniphila]QVL30828.1 hypothetical protein KIH39_18495 [Telmatocola sphagniphila]
MAFTDPSAMLDHIRGPKDRVRGPGDPLNYVIATDHQFLLWGCACCRHLGPIVDDPRWLKAIQSVEQFSEGRATYAQLLAVGVEMENWFAELGGYANTSPKALIARSCADLTSGVDSAYDSMRTPFLPAMYEASRWAVAAVRESAGEKMAKRELALQCDFLRDIVGNPFTPLTVQEEWKSARVVELAEQIYLERSFAQLPALATELIQSKCDNQLILEHCYSTEPHVKGCWVIDMFRRVENLRWDK